MRDKTKWLFFLVAGFVFIAIGVDVLSSHPLASILMFLTGALSFWVWCVDSRSGRQVDASGARWSAHAVQWMAAARLEIAIEEARASGLNDAEIVHLVAENATLNKLDCFARQHD